MACVTMGLGVEGFTMRSPKSSFFFFKTDEPSAASSPKLVTRKFVCWRCRLLETTSDTSGVREFHDSSSDDKTPSSSDRCGDVWPMSVPSGSSKAVSTETSRSGTEIRPGIIGTRSSACLAGGGAAVSEVNFSELLVPRVPVFTRRCSFCTFCM